MSIFLANQSNSKRGSHNLLQNEVIGIIGLGTMGSAILSSLLKSKTTKKILIKDNSVEKEKQFQSNSKQHSIEAKELSYLTKNASIILIAIKPQDFFNSNIVANSSSKLIVSIMAGIKINKIKKLTKSNKIVRVMPNICAIVGESYSSFSCSKAVTLEEKNKIKQLLNCFGSCEEVKESELDSITAICGSGPAFVAYLMQTFVNSAKKQKLNEEASTKMIAQLFFGTSKLILENKFELNELIKQVSSKKGTTIAGLSILTKSGIQKTINNTIKKASKRSKELSRGRK